MKDLLLFILKKKTAFYILTFSFFFFSNGINCQDLFLRIVPTLEKNKGVIQKISYQEKHSDTITLHSEILKIEQFLKSIGYYSVLIKKISTKKDTIVANFTLGKKIKTVLISIDATHSKILKKFNPKKGVITLPSEELATTLSNISKELDSKGFSFSETSLQNTTIKGAVLFADLHIVRSTKRNINKVIVKGYEKFPEPYLKHFLKITPQTTFTNKKLKDISKKLTALSFVTQTKQIETLFKKDSTIVYLYLKKKRNNRFDGLINFNSNDAGKVQLNGYLDLKLNSIFNRGEELSLLWNRFDNDRQELNLNAKIPFLFNTPISSGFEFSLYKQDSTFINTHFKTNFGVFLNERLQLAADYTFTSSKIIEANTTSEGTAPFSSQFIGLQLKYNLPLNDLFSNQKINLILNPKIGQRTSSTTTSNQFKIDLFSSYLFEINPRNSLYIANKTGYLTSNDFLLNELYRIGGAKSIRGFTEQSLFAAKFSYFNVEYRFLTSTKSFVYTITDYGEFKNQTQSNKIYSIGAGYQFITNNSHINISYALGKMNQQPFDSKDSKINISLITFF